MSLQPALWTGLLGAAVIAAAIATALGIARAARRGARAHTREAVSELTRAIEAFLEGRLRAPALRSAVRLLDPAAFWTAVETLPPGLKRSARRRLSRALARTRPVRSERRALRGESPWRRELSARRLGLVGSHASRRALRAALMRGPENVTLAAAVALARDRDRVALGWILAHPTALGTRTVRVRTALLREFGRGALPTLADTLARGPEDPGLERAIVETLGIHRFRAALPAIASRLGHGDLEVRVAAARALGRIEARECAAELVGALADSAWQVRALAAWALGRARAPQAVAALSVRLTDRAWWARRHAAYALRELGEEGHAALRHAAERSSDPYARDIALEVLQGGWPVGA